MYIIKFSIAAQTQKVNHKVNNRVIKQNSINYTTKRT